MDQKRVAVDHYLTHGRRLSRTIHQLEYPSKTLLAAWIDELRTGLEHLRAEYRDAEIRLAIMRKPAELV